MSAVYFKKEDKDRVERFQKEIPEILDLVMYRFKKISEGADGTYNFGSLEFKLQRLIDEAKGVLTDVLYEELWQ